MIQRVLLLMLSLAVSARADVILEALRWFPPEAEAVAAVRGPSEIGWSLLHDLFDHSTDAELRGALGPLRVKAGVIAATKIGNRSKGEYIYGVLGVGFLPACAVVEFTQKIPTELWKGQPVIRKSQLYFRKYETHSRSLQWVRLAPKLLLVCNDEQLLDSTIRRHASPPSTSKFEESKLWNRAFKTAPIWAMRVQPEQQFSFRCPPGYKELIEVEVDQYETEIRQRFEFEDQRLVELLSHLQRAGFVAKLSPMPTSAP